MKRFLIIQDSKEPLSTNEFDLESEFDYDDNMIVIDSSRNTYCVDGKTWNEIQ